ncbi:maleylacetoacetate isomerase [Profundibacter amoris]|uniref:Maleylacetoacetate isomerase n=1 Tax=Profundibacter amoris TaxID=2171755 RepID=A0A347UC97_9RHOB|nr:maleylacetoacetate isomerase [Profundibacter amoris]AXX96475.1 maleylacetoacetate isomerase [Profundibacter amoris]
MRLYSYWRSTAAYRVRIALNMKGIAYETVPVDLVADGGRQHAPDYVALNPAHLVPTLILDDGTPLTQSLAICEYLDITNPEPPLLPSDPVQRAHVKAAALVVAADIHPVNNLRVVQHLGKTFGATPEDKAEWMRHWMRTGFDALQQMVRDDTPFAFGDMPGFSDICLVAQYYNARRWDLDLTPYARLTEIEQNCLALPAFDAARPENQPDAQI